VSLHRTLFDMMNGVATREAIARGEEQVGIIGGQMK
jgi:hypothetical protein